MKAFFWPVRQNDDSKSSVRIGRVFHWAFTALAIAFLVASPATLAADYLSVSASIKDHKNWVNENPEAKVGKDNRLTFRFPLKNGYQVETEGDEGKTRSEAIEHLKGMGYLIDDRPEYIVRTLNYALPAGLPFLRSWHS